MSSVREARQALINVVNDQDVHLDPEDREDVYVVIGLLDEYVEVGD